MQIQLGPDSVFSVYGPKDGEVNLRFRCTSITSCQLDDSCLDLKVLVENRRKLTVSICGSQERDTNDILCELNVTLPPRNDTDVQLALPESLSNCFVIIVVTFFRKPLVKKIFHTFFFLSRIHR